MYFAGSQVGHKLGQHITLQRRHEEPVEKPCRHVFKPGKGTATSKDAFLRPDSLEANKTYSGVFGRLGTELGGILQASADYQYLAGGDDPKQQLRATASLSQRLLQNIPRLSRARAYYQKNNIGRGLNREGDPRSEDGFLESTEDTFYGYEIGLEMASGVTILWDSRFLFQRGADNQLERQKIVTIETVFSF